MKQYYDITPGTDLIRSMREAEWIKGSISEKWAGALGELADNSIGKNRGACTQIHIFISPRKQEVRVWDDGVGVRNMADLAKPGSRDEKREVDDEDLGQFGVGGTNACVWLGKKVEVRTIHEGVYKWMFANWDKIEKSGEWKIAGTESTKYTGDDLGDPRLAAFGGTLFRITGVDKFPPVTQNHRMWQATRDLLARTYTPALEKGIRITWELEGTKPQLLTPWQPSLAVVTHVPIDYNVSGKDYHADLYFGEGDVVVRDIGVSVDFSFRRITHSREFFGEYASRVTGVYGRLVLGSSFKNTLTRHKEEVKFQHDALLKTHVMAAMEDLLKTKAEAAQELRITRILNGIALDIEARLSRKTKAVEDDDGEPALVPGDEEPGPHPGPGPKPVTPSKKKIDAEEDEDGDDVHMGAKGGTVQILPTSNEEMEGMLAVCEADPAGLTIRINKDHDDMEKALDDPANEIALSYTAWDAIGRCLAGEGTLIHRFAPGFRASEFGPHEGGHEAAHAVASYLAWGESK